MRKASLLAACMLLAGLTHLAHADGLSDAKAAYAAVAAKANEGQLNKFARKEWDAVKATVAQAEAKAKAGDAKAAADLYKQASKSAKDATDLAAYAEASAKAASAADAKQMAENFKRAVPIVAALEKEKDRWAARELLVRLEELIPNDPRMPGLRDKAKALPVPRETMFYITYPSSGVREPIKLVLVPAGTFTMGSPQNDNDRGPDEGPQHEVTFSKPFYMSMYPVTNAQYRAAMWGHGTDQAVANYPVTDVTHDSAMGFCKNVSSSKVKRSVRLPTEAEWEYACRAGTRARFYGGDKDTDLDSIAWYQANSEGQLHVVGQKKPNAFGLYDMHGNAWQLVADYYAASYPEAKATDPQGPQGGASRLARGGSWRCYPLLCRSAYRYIIPQNFSADDVGFRIVASWQD